MKKLQQLFLCALTLLPFMAFSQNGFIEIEVRDSVQIKAISFEYVIAPEEDYTAMAYVDAEADEKINEMKAKDVKKMKLATIESFLKNNKYNYISLADSNFNVNGTNNLFRLGLNGNEGYQVTLNSLDELKKITNEVKQMDKVTGNVSKVNYESQTSYEEPLFKKLIEKGKAKAQSIAKISNMVLGKIMEIREVKSAENSNFNFMDMIMKLDKKRNFSTADDILNSSYSKALIIKFKAE